jgi:hypothetical protein
VNLLEQTTTTARAVVPRVNLLPPEIAEHRRFARLRLALAGALVATLAGIGGLYVVAYRASEDAAALVQVENDRGSVIARASARYAMIPELENQARAAESSLQTAMAQEVRWSYFLNDVSSVIPADAWLTGLTMTQPVGPESVAGAPPVPGASTVGGSAAGIASLTYRGVGLSYPAVASWLEAQEAITDSDDPYVTNTVDVKVGENEVVDFATTATVNDGAYSHRFDTPQGIGP